MFKFLKAKTVSALPQVDFEKLGIKLLANKLKLSEQKINDSFSHSKPWYVALKIGDFKDCRDALLYVKKAFDFAGWDSSKLNFTLERDRSCDVFAITITLL